VMENSRINVKTIPLMEKRSFLFSNTFDVSVGDLGEKLSLFWILAYPLHTTNYQM